MSTFNYLIDSNGAIFNSASKSGASKSSQTKYWHVLASRMKPINTDRTRPSLHGQKPETEIKPGVLLANF